MLIGKTMEYNGWTKRETIVAALTLVKTWRCPPLDREATLREIDEKEERYEQNKKKQRREI
jgi:hypothetical protein